MTTFEGHDFLDGDTPVFEYDGLHTTDVFTARLIKLLDLHMATTPNKVRLYKFLVSHRYLA